MPRTRHGTRISRRLFGIAAALAAALATGGGQASAQAPSPERSFFDGFMVRVRGLAVIPDASGKISQVPGSDVKITTSGIPELDISYFFTPNIAAELILGVTPHRIKGDGTLSGVPVGKTWLLPPTLTLQYHFTNWMPFKPYIGGGVNYTIFFNQRAAGGAVQSMHIRNSFAPALQFGFDYMLTKNIGINVDAKKLWLRPSVSLNGGALTGRVHIDPWIVGGGLVYRF